MSVHDVAMNPIGACSFDTMDFVTEPREIGGKNGRGDDDSLHSGNGAKEEWINDKIPTFRYWSSPLLQNKRLTALPAASCYGVSAWPNRAAGRSCEKGSAQTDERVSFGLESASKK